MEGQDSKVNLFPGIQDSVVLDGLTLLSEKMDTMDKKMDLKMDKWTKNYKV